MRQKRKLSSGRHKQSGRATEPGAPFGPTPRCRLCGCFSAYPAARLRHSSLWWFINWYALCSLCPFHVTPWSLCRGVRSTVLLSLIWHNWIYSVLRFAVLIFIIIFVRCYVFSRSSCESAFFSSPSFPRARSRLIPFLSFSFVSLLSLRSQGLFWCFAFYLS